MTRALVVALNTLILLSCSNSDQIPENLLPQDQIIAIWGDILLAEGAIDEMRYQNFDTARGDFKFLEKAIFAKHQTDSAQYRESLEYYSQDIALLDSLHQILVDTLSYRENLLKETSRVQDEDAEKEALERPSSSVPSSDKANKQKTEISIDTTSMDKRTKRLRYVAEYLKINLKEQTSNSGK